MDLFAGVIFRLNGAEPAVLGLGVMYSSKSFLQAYAIMLLFLINGAFPWSGAKQHQCNGYTLDCHGLNIFLKILLFHFWLLELGPGWGLEGAACRDLHLVVLLVVLIIVPFKF